jgi:predicted Fe-S protein YdhL (DUF1289 family)
MDDVWSKPADPIVDPCQRKCGVSSALGYCRGCYMTLDEIVKWSSATESEQRAILDNAKERKEKAGVTT